MLLACSAVVAIACGPARDANVTSSVKAKLAADDTVKAYNIDVDTKNGVVTLTGTVGTAAEETQALDIARTTEGVTEVQDQIEIAPSQASNTVGSIVGDIETAAGDAGVTAAVKAKLLADDHVGGLRIDVDTDAGVVTLSGTVRSADERSRAVEIARQVEGVRDVSDRLTVRSE
jgi:osmotically-inducible protein OsmY